MLKTLLHLALAATFALQACTSTPADPSEARNITEKQRWYWLGSTSLDEHFTTSSPENYWFEIDGEKATIQTKCIEASAKARTSKEKRLWLSKISVNQKKCPSGQNENHFIRQITRVNLAEQRSTLLKINLEQYGEAMFFSTNPGDTFVSYRCEGGEILARIDHKDGTSFWKGDEYSLRTSKETNSSYLEHENCRKSQ